MARGSAGNVIAALASFFIAGLGQLVQGRLGAAFGFGAVWFVLVFFLLIGAAPVVLFLAPLAIWAAVDAAIWDPDAPESPPPPAPRQHLTPEERAGGRKAFFELMGYTVLGLAATALALWWMGGRL